MSQNECELSESSKQHTCEAQNRSEHPPTSAQYRCYDTQPLWWKYSYSECISHICFICLLLYTSNTISLSHTWMNDFYIHYTGRSLEKERGRVLFMIWLWLFMMGITICARNNYRMILKASEWTLFPQSSNFNIKKAQQNKQQLRDYNKTSALQATWMTA